MNYSIIGLIVDIIGAFAMFIGADVLNKDVLNLIKNPPDRSDAVAGISENEISRLSDLNKAANRSAKYTRRGLLLIVLGFALQLLGSIK